MTALTAAGQSARARYEAHKVAKAARHGFHFVHHFEPGALNSVGSFDLVNLDKSEFKDGEVNASLRRMRTDDDVTVVAEDVVVGTTTRTVYFVASERKINDKIYCLKVWLRREQENPREVPAEWEHALFVNKFVHYMRQHMVTSTCWWSLENDMIWTFDEAIATQIRLDILNPAK